MNLEVAAGWLSYCGLTKVCPHCILQEESVRIHLSAGKWVEHGAKSMTGGREITVDCGECHSATGGAFLGRFLVVKLNGMGGEELYAVAASARTDGGDVSGGAAVLQTVGQVKGLCEDIGRAVTLPRAERRKSLSAVMGKWEGMNSPGWDNPFLRRRVGIGKGVFQVFGWLGRTLRK